MITNIRRDRRRLAAAALFWVKELICVAGKILCKLKKDEKITLVDGGEGLHFLVLLYIDRSLPMRSLPEDKLIRQKKVIGYYILRSIHFGLYQL
jgi:hypothetical protein